MPANKPTTTRNPKFRLIAVSHKYKLSISHYSKTHAFKGSHDKNKPENRTIPEP